MRKVQSALACLQLFLQAFELLAFKLLMVQCAGTLSKRSPWVETICSRDYSDSGILTPQFLHPCPRMPRQPHCAHRVIASFSASSRRAGGLFGGGSQTVSCENPIRLRPHR